MKVKAIGFIGFGEVAYQISKGISSNFRGDLFAFDVAIQNSTFASQIKERAEKAKAKLVSTPKEVAENCEVIFGCVPASFALEAANNLVPYLSSNHLYLDVSASHPSVKTEISKKVGEKSASFCDIAITGPVLLLGHQVPMMASGIIPEPIYSTLIKLGMQIEVISERPGEASAIKLCRSIFTKGLEALLVECVLVAQSMKVDKKVLESIEQTLSQQSFIAAANRYITSNAIHANRRVHEVEDAAVMIRGMGLTPLVTEGVLQRMKWCAERDGRQQFGLEQPSRYSDVINYYLSSERVSQGGDKRATS